MDRYCPVWVGDLPTGEGIACGRLLDRDGKCPEHGRDEGDEG